MSVSVIPEFENEDEQWLETDDAVVQPVPDARANIPVSETTERFLRAVLAKVPLDRIEELHLFAPLRQGTAETGIAVIAARVVAAAEPEVPDLELQLEAAPDVDAAADSDVDVRVEVVATADGTADADMKPADVVAVAESNVELAEVDAADVEMPERDSASATATVAAEDPFDDPMQSPDAEDAHDDSPYADEPSPGKAQIAFDLVHELAPDVADELPLEPPAPRVRHTVYTARYRLVIKGPDRGKWEMDVVDEADAPLLAVESVVRGVQRRAGEETATVRYDAQQLARVLRLIPPN